MNYKLTSGKFIKLKETFGFIENTSDALIEFAITTGKPVFNDKGNQLVIANGKLSYELEEGQGIYARPVDRLSGEINVSEVRINNSDIDGDYYTKVEVDNNFVKKEGNKVLSDENFTNAEKEKLAGLNYATENPLANGIANVGISTKIAREDHVHPVQTSISGNAGTATKLQAPRNLTLNGAITGTTNFDGSTDATIETTLSNLDGSKVTALTGYTKASESTAITPTDNLLVALGKLEKGLEGATPSILSTQGNTFSLHYCTKSEYDSLDKIQDDSTIYLVLDESTGEIVIKVYRP